MYTERAEKAGNMEELEQIKQPIATELAAYRRLFEQTLKQDNPLLQLALDHLLQRQGKMMRPILTLLAARCAGKVNDAVLNAAVSLELLHTASLVHDDVVDSSDRRRGQKSVNALLDNRAAVLVGDYLLSKALSHAAATGSNRVVAWVAKLGQTLSDGELLQLANLDKTDISEEDYYEVIRKKTASLFETCAKAGALLGGGQTADVEWLTNFGQGIGNCFQLRDDLLDYGSPTDTGKPTGNDMKEGKLTLPVIHALLTTANAAMHDIAIRVRRGEATDEEITCLVNFTHKQGGLEYAGKKLDEMGNFCIKLLHGKQGNASILNTLSHYVHFVIGREN